MKSRVRLTVIEGGKPYRITPRDLRNMQRDWARMMWIPFDIGLAMWLMPFEVMTYAVRGSSSWR